VQVVRLVLRQRALHEGRRDLHRRRRRRVALRARMLALQPRAVTERRFHQLHPLRELPPRLPSLGCRLRSFLRQPRHELTTRRAPPAASSLAIDAPMPRDAPVTRATRPAKPAPILDIAGSRHGDDGECEECGCSALRKQELATSDRLGDCALAQAANCEPAESALHPKGNQGP